MDFKKQQNLDRLRLPEVWKITSKLLNKASKRLRKNAFIDILIASLSLGHFLNEFLAQAELN